MLINHTYKSGVLIFLGIFILSSCRTSQPTQTPTSISPTDKVDTVVEITHTATQDLQDVYPAPDQGGIETQRATESVIVVPLTSTETPEPYPQPTNQTAITSPTSEGPYPFPPPIPTTFSPYPEPGTATTSLQPTIVEPTRTQASMTATATLVVVPTSTATPTSLSPTPSAVPTRIIIRTEILPTDPNTFRVISGRAQLVEFFAFWSPLSKSMAPVVHLLEDQYGDRINFIYLDIDDPKNSLYKGLMGEKLPPIFFLLDGQGVVQQEWIGYVPAAELEDAIQRAQP